MSLEVVRGNPVNVFVVTDDQLDVLKSGSWDRVRTYSAFNAVKTRTFRQTSRLSTGTYYLVLHDPTLGILSERASDVSVKADLRP